MKKKKTVSLVQLLLTACLFCFSVKITSAQTDTKFWFVAPEVSLMHGDKPIQISIAAIDKDAGITVSQPANPSFKTIVRTIPADSIQRIDLTEYISEIENETENTVLKSGLYIEASTPVSAFYEVANQSNPEIFTLKGERALGKNFLIPSQNNYPNAYGSEAFDIVATENNTTVTITVTDEVIGHKANETFTVKLNKGEAYSVRAVGTEANNSLAGSKILADKPIAVTISDDSINTDGWDLIGDQIVPVKYLGTEYVAIKGFANDFDCVYILATAPNTTIDVDNSRKATLDAGETYRVILKNDAALINTSEPVYAYHLSGYRREAGSALLPSVACTGSKKVRFSRTSFGAIALFILTKEANSQNFLLNGEKTKIPSTAFIPVAKNSDWVYARMKMDTELKTGVIYELENTTGLFHIGILNKLAQSAEYAYYSDYQVSYLGNDIFACFGDTVTLNASIGEGSYNWSTGAIESTIEVTKPGKYWVKITSGSCTGVDTITVKLDTLPQIDWNNKASVIKGKEQILNAYTPGAEYNWNNGSDNSTLTVTQQGAYWVEVTKGYCKRRYETEVKEIEIEFNTQNITFDFGKSTLTTDAKTELDKLIDFLTKKTIAKISISAHTDNVGSFENNMKLSEERAASVMKYMISKGIAKNRMSAKGYADNMPVADNDTEEGRHKNRRVEINIVVE